VSSPSPLRFEKIDPSTCFPTGGPSSKTYIYIYIFKPLHDRYGRRWSLSPRVCVRWPRLYKTSTRHRRALSHRSEFSQPCWRPGRILSFSKTMLMQ
jgi:hypothetical protein